MLITLLMLKSLLAAMRRLAPANPALAGLAADIVSGASGVLVYSLHCPETRIPFIATWYTFGIAITGLLGMIGRHVWLRW
ncbi:NrsF family protein [Brucella pituitosa]|uniref:NrsF family protein n=1 Tax=Brucella pituitosa TaxID=571256 RepID=UPI0031F2E08B